MRYDLIGKSQDFIQFLNIFHLQNLSSFKFINFVRSHAFEAIAFASYIVYVVVLMGDHYYSTAQFQQILIHYVLSILLIVEIFLRGCAYRKEFFTNFWNRFDVVIVVFLIIGESNC